WADDSVMERIEEDVPLLHGDIERREYPGRQLRPCERRDLDNAVTDPAEVAEITGHRHRDDQEVEQEVTEPGEPRLPARHRGGKRRGRVAQAPGDADDERQQNREAYGLMVVEPGNQS